jgi:hypothetical protein
MNGPSAKRNHYFAVGRTMARSMLNRYAAGSAPYDREIQNPGAGGLETSAPGLETSGGKLETSGGNVMTKRRAWVAATVAGLVALALPIGWVGADNVRIEVTPQPQPPSTTVIVPPPQPPPSSTTVIVPPPATPVAPTPPQVLNADQIKANQVRADTIYANRIEADQVLGQVHQTRDVKIRDTRGEIKAPEVTAATIYADEITANSVIAQHVFVRDLRRR